MLPKRQGLTAAQQLLILRGSKSPGTGSLRNEKLRWTFSAQPLPLSRQYRIGLTYRPNKPPRVYVLEPDLRLLTNGRPIPHVYSQAPVSLCLYYPKAQEWSPAMKLSETIIPWSFLWLFYFEDWLATGEWNGGGRHPKVRHARSKKNPVH